MLEIDPFYWNLARLFAGIKGCFALVGICSNLVLLIVTIKTKSLRATFNILIAVCAAADIIHECGVASPIPFILGYHFEIDSDICSLFMILPVIGIAVGCACILCVGLDRLMSVVYPAKYQRMNKCIYHLVFASIIIAYSACYCVVMFVYYEQRPVLCETVTPFRNDKAMDWLVKLVLSISFVSAIVYFILWLSLRSQTNSIQMKRIIKSLLIIVVFDVCAWISTPSLFTLFRWLKFDSQQMFTGSFFCKIPLNIALSIKLFIYYSTSSEYRAAINNVLFGNSSPLKALKPNDSKTANLRATCNILIAICAVGDIFHQIAVLFPAPSAFDIYIEIESDVCLAFMFLPAMGTAVGCCCIFCVGLDRFFAIVFPLRYQQLNSNNFILKLLTILTLSYCSFQCVLMHVYYRKRLEFCELTSAFPDEGLMLYVDSFLVINVASAIVYFIMWLNLRTRIGSDKLKRGIKSLLIIVSSEVCCWIAAPGLFQLFKLLKFDDHQMFAGKLFSKIFLNIALTILFHQF